MVYRMQPGAFLAWLSSAELHDSCMYYQGRSLFGHDLKMTIIEQAWQAACAGQVYLVQRKLGHELYDYLAIRARNMPARYVARPLKRVYTQKDEGTDHAWTADKDAKCEANAGQRQVSAVGPIQETLEKGPANETVLV